VLLSVFALLAAGCDQYHPDTEPDYLRTFQLFPNEV
jgi:hypothetical protein